jgi:hypothetical protein
MFYTIYILHGFLNFVHALSEMLGRVQTYNKLSNPRPAKVVLDG